MTASVTTRRRARGSTLVELMVSMVILGFVLSATMGVLIAMNNSSARVTAVSNTQEAARGALDSLSADIRSAGLGMATGLVGVATAASSTSRVPVIFSGPDYTIFEPTGARTLVTNSIFIVSSDPATVGIPADGSGMQGVVLNATIGSPLVVGCFNSAGASVSCGGSSGLIGSGAPYPPLIVGDFRSAVYLRPTNYQLIGSTGTLQYAEQSFNAFSPDPKAPFGFAPGATMSHAWVAHWYLRQDDANAPPRLYRSHPILNPAQLTCSQQTSTPIYPFQDYVSGLTGTDTMGVEMGAGPVESLQVRYVVDDQATDDPQKFDMVNYISSCDGYRMAQLREVRIQLVAIATLPDRTTSGSRVAVNYSTPAFEGVSATSTGTSSSSTDAYPRRAYVTRTVPRALQGIRL
jgi:type II secretory pathway pseudopilin PulG